MTHPKRCYNYRQEEFLKINVLNRNNFFLFVKKTLFLKIKNDLVCEKLATKYFDPPVKPLFFQLQVEVE